MRTNVELFSPHGFSLVEADVDGVALWCRHDQWALPAWRELLLVPRMLRFTGLPRLARLRDGFDTMKAHHPRTPHYYLFMIGVRADRQGQGLGAALMRPMLERCEAEGVAAYLEASSPRNIAFYRRMGFEERETFAFGPGGPPLCAMWWEPGGRRHSGERAR
jgi:ribosomal protein S18 acetylase RimI-like enzyme